MTKHSTSHLPSPGINIPGYRSITTRLVLGLLVALIVSGTILAAMSLWLGHLGVRQQHEQAAARLVQVFEASLHNSMLQRDLGSLQNILRALGEAPGIRQARLVNTHGEVRFASNADAVGQHVELECTGSDCQGKAMQHQWDVNSQGQALRSAYPIVNRLPCLQCHGDPMLNPVNGVLLVDFAPLPAADLSKPNTWLFGLSLAMLVLFGSIMALTLKRVVTGPLLQLTDASGRLAAGDYDARIESPGHDEIGQVARQFNAMADQIEQTVQKLRWQQEFLQDLVDAIPDPILVIGPDWEIRVSNTAYARLLGRDPDEPVQGRCYKVGRGLDEPCPSTLVNCPHAQLKQSQSSSLRTIMTMRHRDGHDVPVEIDAATLVTSDGNYTVEVLRPLEKAIRFSQEQRLSTIGLLANGVAHEIHNPLASIRLALQASLRELRSGEFDPAELINYLVLVDSQIDRCVATTQRLMQMSRPPGEKLEPVCLRTAIEDVIALLSEDARLRQVRLEYEPPDERVWLRADHAELCQIFVNLFHNAMHAMPHGGSIRIDGETTANGRAYHIKVSDTGAGIAAENLSRIFLPFFSRRADGQPGMGLGLAVCKSIADRFGGDIEATSTPGEGSVFHIIIPLVQSTSATSLSTPIRS